MFYREYIRKISEYKKNHTEKNALAKKIYSQFLLFLRYHMLSISYIFLNPKLNKEQTDRIYNWKWYVYLRRKYKKVINRLPLYKLPEDTTIPKIIWWCWFQGEENAPVLCHSCLNSLRLYMPEYEIRIITEHNMWDFINVPAYIHDKYKKGIITKTHFSDILRTCLLVEHGGIWIDSTVLCTGNIPTTIFNKILFIYQNYKRGDEACALSSWLIAACKNEPALTMTRELLFIYWSKKNHLCHYFLFHLFFTMICEQYPQILNNMPRYSNLPPHILQFEMFMPYDDIRWEQIKNMSPFHKLSWKYDTKLIDTNGTYYEHILREFVYDNKKYENKSLLH